jgi:ATP-dependent 26S proteasome regulatory subunit
MKNLATKPSEVGISSRYLELELEYLQAELARIDVLLRREIQRWQLAGQNPRDAFRGLYISDSDANALVSRPFATSWGQTTALAMDDECPFDEALEQASLQSQKLVESFRLRGQNPRLEQLAADFGLDPFEKDVLLICLAGTLDLRYERIYGYLQDDVTRKRPTVNLTLDLLCAPGPEKLLRLAHFSPNAPLFRYNILELYPESSPGRIPLLAQTLTIDDGVSAWLTGRYQPHADIATTVSLEHPQPNETDELLTAEVFQEISRSIKTQSIYVLHGVDKAGQEAATRILAIQSQRPILVANLPSGYENIPQLSHMLHLIFRDARMIGAIPVIIGWDTCTTEKELPHGLITELWHYPDTLILVGRSDWCGWEYEDDRKLVSIEFPIPSYVQRCRLWEHFLGSKTQEKPVITGVASQFLLTASQIRQAVAAACDISNQRSSTIQEQDLITAARNQSSSQLASLTRKITPRYTWQDIVLPNDQIDLLHEIIGTVRGRPRVLDEWGVGQKLASSRGVTILFAGLSGTGKTMAAEIIARELGLDLYKIDLSTIVSKYIGDTEKNLERIFSEAETSNAILFFDEADALFGKRSEVRDSHDRYANIEISYLLQRMEAYDGVTILATNLRANLDEAFTRRLQFAVDFPFPDETHRLRIWQALFSSDVPRHPDIDFIGLAQRFKLAGGNIRNVIVGAAYLAASDGGRVTMSHLLHVTRRELQKMGRLVDEPPGES